MEKTQLAIDDLSCKSQHALVVMGVFMQGGCLHAESLTVHQHQQAATRQSLHKLKPAKPLAEWLLPSLACHTKTIPHS